MHIEEEKMYIRQTTLPEIGEEGQKQLLKARIAIVGCGGLGSAAAVYLAASGIGHIHLIDYDKIDLSNLHRQVFYHHDQVGLPKAKTLAAYIEKMNPTIQTSYLQEPITKSNISDHLDAYSIIVDCTDSLATKYLLNDYCVLHNKELVYGSLYKHDGYVAVFNVKDQNGHSTNLRDAFPSMPKKHIPNCSEIGTLNPIVGIIGLMQANEVIKLLTNTGSILKDKILIYNSMENSQFTMKLERGYSLEKIKETFDADSYFDSRCVIQEEDLLINAVQLKEKMKDKGVKIISVIEDTSVPLPFKVDLKIPLSSLEPDQLSTFSDAELIVVCQRGISSYTATLRIKKMYPGTAVYSLKDGINQF